MDGESCSPHSSRETIFERPISGSSEWPLQAAASTSYQPTLQQHNQQDNQSAGPNTGGNRQQQEQQSREQSQVNDGKTMEAPAIDSEQPAAAATVAEVRKPETRPRLVTRPTSLFSSHRAETLRDMHLEQQQQPPVSRPSEYCDQTVPQSSSSQQLASSRVHQRHHNHNHNLNQSMNTTTSTTSAQTAVSMTDSSSQVQQISGKRQQHSGGGSASDLSCVDPQNPYPLYAPITFFYLNQTARPRSWCLAIVSNKYPDH